MSKIRPSDFEQLLLDYQRDNKRIWKQAVAWLTPKDLWSKTALRAKEKRMGKLPTKSQMRSTEDEPADGSQGDEHTNKSSSNKPLDPKSKKSGKSANSSSSKDMSPVRQIMKAVTSHALNPKQRKVKRKVGTNGESQGPGAKPSKAVADAEFETKGKTKDTDGDYD